ncbi:MAG: DUF4861 domain-containing protein [Cyclobacteriaceae bacterium]
MKCRTVGLLIISITFCLFSCEKGDGRFISLVNPTATTLLNQPVVIKRSDFGITADKYVRIQSTDASQLPVQFDDMDSDGLWDEMVFLIDVSANEQLKLPYSLISKEDMPFFPILTNAHLGVSEKRNDDFRSVNGHTMPTSHEPQSKPYLYQFEGPGWENDKIAFRAYFDDRNGKDIFGKTVPDVVLEQVGINENYHQLQPWGMDVLKVGNSLGAGSLAFTSNDSLYRLTDVDTQHVSIISEGPVRSVIRFQYEGWRIAGQTITITELIQIWAGKFHYDSEIKTDSLTNGQIAVGMVNLYDLSLNTADHPSLSVFYTHGQQSENKDVLGMALLAPKQLFTGKNAIYEKETGISDTYYMTLHSNENAVYYSFLGGWELSDHSFADKNQFQKHLTTVTTYYSNPLEISITQ